MTNIKRINTYMINEKIEVPLNTYQYALSKSLVNHEAPTRSNQTAAFKTLLSKSKFVQVKLSYNFVMDYVHGNELKLQKNTFFVLQALTRYVDINYKITLDNLYGMHLLFGMHPNTYTEHLKKLEYLGLILFKEGDYYVTKVSHVCVKPFRPFDLPVESKDSEANYYLKEYDFLTDYCFIKTLTVKEHRLLYGFLASTLLSKISISRQLVNNHFKLLRLTRNKGFSKMVELESEPIGENNTNEFLIALIKFWKKGIVSFSFDQNSNSGVTASKENEELTPNELALERGIGFKQKERNDTKLLKQSNKELYTELVTNLKKALDIKYLSKSVFGNLYLSVKVFHNKFTEIPNCASRTFVEQKLRLVSPISFEAMFSNSLGVFDKQENQYNLMNNLKRELSVVNAELACMVTKESMTNFINDTKRTLVQKVNAEVAHSIYKDSYFLPMLEKLIITELQMWLVKIQRNEKAIKELVSPLNAFMNIHEFDFLLRFYVRHSNRIHLVSFITNLEKAIWETGSIVAQSDSFSLYDRLTNRFDTIHSLFAKYVSSVRNLYQQLVVDTRSSDFMTEEKFAELLPATHAMTGYTGKDVIAEYIKNIQIEMNEMVEQQEMANEVTNYQVMRLDATQIMPLQLEKAVQYGVLPAYKTATKLMQEQTLRVLLVAENLKKLLPNDPKIQEFVSSLYREIVLKFEMHSSLILNNIRNSGDVKAVTHLQDTYLIETDSKLQDMSAYIANLEGTQGLA